MTGKTLLELSQTQLVGAGISDATAGVLAEAILELAVRPAKPKEMKPKQPAPAPAAPAAKKEEAKKEVEKEAKKEIEKIPKREENAPQVKKEADPKDKVSSSSEKPEKLLPPGWVEEVNPQSGQTMYKNTQTKETQAEAPKLTISDTPFFAAMVRVSPLDSLLDSTPDSFYVTLDEAVKMARFKGGSYGMLRECREKAEKMEKKGFLKPLGMTTEEAAAIFVYTYEGEGYKTINKVLATRNIDALFNLRGYIFHLLNALRKLPRYTKKKVLYRGIDGGSVAWGEDNHAVGCTLTWPAFTSTTATERVIKDFVQYTLKPVVFEIRGDFNGCSISDFSFIKDEDEILLEPETTFVIKEVKKDFRFPKATRIIVEVVKTEPVIKELIENFSKNVAKHNAAKGKK